MASYGEIVKHRAGTQTNTIDEYTAASGVRVDGVLLKDAGVTASGGVSTNTITEFTSGSGVTIDGVLLKDSGITATGTNTINLTTISADTINETTSGSGVTVDSVLLKDGNVSTLASGTVTTTYLQAKDTQTFALKNSTGTSTVTVTNAGLMTVPANTTHTFGNTATVAAAAVRALSSTTSVSYFLADAGGGTNYFGSNYGTGFGITDAGNGDAIIYAASAGDAVRITAGGATTTHLLVGSTGSVTVGASGTATDNFVFNYTGGAVRPSGDNQVNFGLAGQRWATIYAGTGTINTSDERLKSNIQAMENVLDKVMLLAPSTWESKYQSYFVGKSGFVAQQLESVFPDLVRTENATIEGHDNIKTVAVSGPEMAAILVKAIQEQQALIEALQAKVAVLEAR